MATPTIESCPRCNVQRQGDERFCSSCGAAFGTSPTEVSSQKQGVKVLKDAAMTLFRMAARDPSGLLKAVIVCLVIAVICWIGWTPLSWPARLISTFITPGDCSSYSPGTRVMYFCSAWVAARTMAGPLIVMAIVFLLRGRLMKAARKLVEKLPVETHFLTAPVIAAVLFTLTWSAVHYQSDDGSGLLSQQLFPVVIGLFTFASSQYGSVLQGKLKPVFDRRDRVPRFLRFVIALLVPLVISLAITYQDRVSATAFKEQLVLLISLCTGYLALAPRHGDLLSGVRAIVASPKGAA